MDQNDLKTYFQGFPEAPASNSLKWIDADGFEHQTTLRDWSFAGLMDKTQLLVGIIKKAGGHPLKDLGKPAPAPVAAATKAQPAPQATTPPGQQPQAPAVGQPVPPAPDGKLWQTTDAVFVKILPQADEKVNIEFYGNKFKQPYDKFPCIKVMGRSIKNMAPIMAEATSADLTKAQNLQLHCRIYWVEGSEYKKTDGTTGRHQDVYHIRAL